MTATARAPLVAALIAMSACSSAYSGAARDFSQTRFRTEPGWVAVPGVEAVEQRGGHDCGAAALATVLRYWGADVTRASVARALGGDGERARIGDMRAVARAHGQRAYVVPASWDDLRHEIERERPVLIGVVQPHGRRGLTHYEVVVAVHPARRLVVTLDPARGWRVRSLSSLRAEWKPARKVALIVLGPSHHAHVAAPYQRAQALHDGVGGHIRDAVRQVHNLDVAVRQGVEDSELE